MDYEAYAIWWVARPGTELAQFGTEWTGWCADRGIVSARSPDGAAAGRGRGGAWLVRRGLHASVRSPFRLAPDRSCWALEDALAVLAERTEAIRLPPLELTVSDGRVALVLAQPEGAVARLVAAVEDAVRPFALPLALAAPARGDAGREGCATAPLEERFHLPLTGRLELGRAYEVMLKLAAMLAPVLARRHWIADLALVGDPGGGRPWRLLQRHLLAGETDRDRAMPAGMSWRGPNLLEPLAGVAGRRGATA